ncbi:permease [Priestia koreensis]|uniref:Permease n=1 Tax=Priestia koreensis TaxID=284581 RepID=A0A0M0L9E6_9BACI|nr:permease [Priestia koreensis]KOO47659.1 hypothetical protein AMD01_06410 [Priestia koreensis]
MTSQSFLQMNTIFISILIEAMPFVLLGVIISGIIQMFVTEEMLAKIIPKNRFLSVVVTTLLGAIFPACECGIIPITKRLIAKGVPLHAAAGFMLTGPVINPVVIFSTYIAFGNSWSMVGQRVGLSFIVALLAGWMISFHFKDSQLKEEIHVHSTAKMPFKEKVSGAIKHTIDEFFLVGKYLVAGSIIAAAMQTYVKTSTLLSIGNGHYMPIVVMMVLAFILSVCSSADAFIASSFRGSFANNALVAFLSFGPMFDIKNTLMMLGNFKGKFVLVLFMYVFIFTFLGAAFLIRGGL